MAYVKQINAEIVVIENAEQALANHPELFELVEGSAPDDFDQLKYKTPE